MCVHGRGGLHTQTSALKGRGQAMGESVHRAFWELDRRFRYIKWVVDPRRALAAEAERVVADRLVGLGYHVAHAGGNSRYDLLLDGAVRVEVKAATWGGRYEWHYHNKADVLILAAKNGSWHFFILPVGVLAGRRNLAVWSENPAAYGGQWAGFLGNWGQVGLVVKQVQQERAGQLPLW
jgi:hypothetical protein